MKRPFSSPNRHYRHLVLNWSYYADVNKSKEDWEKLFLFTTASAVNSGSPENSSLSHDVLNQLCCYQSTPYNRDRVNTLEGSVVFCDVSWRLGNFTVTNLKDPYKTTLMSKILSKIFLLPNVMTHFATSSLSVAKSDNKTYCALMIFSKENQNKTIQTGS